MSYESVILADSPVGYWKLNEASGTSFADSSGNAHNGTLVAAGGTLTYGQTGPFPSEPGDTALLFDAGEYIDTTLQAGSGGWTLEGWIKFPSVPGAWCGMAGFYNNGDCQLAVQYENGTFQFIAGASANDYASYSATLDANWHYVALVFDGSANFYGYLDGSQVLNSTHTSGPLGSDTDFQIGCVGGNGTSKMNGLVAQVAVYNKVLTATQIANHYAAAQTSTGTAAGYLDWKGVVNVLAQTSNLDLLAAVNAWAGTSATPLGLLGALNVVAGNGRSPSGWRGLRAVCNQIAGTTEQEALRALQILAGMHS